MVRLQVTVPPTSTLSLKVSDNFLKMVSSSVKCELLALFRKNSDLKDSIEGLVSRMGSSVEMIEHDVNDLMELGLLKRERTNEVELIAWNRERDKTIQSEICKALLGEQEIRAVPQTRTTRRESVSLK